MFFGPTQRKLNGVSGPVATGPDTDGRDRESTWVFGTVGEPGPSILGSCPQQMIGSTSRMQGKEASEQETLNCTVGIDVSKTWLDAQALAMPPKSALGEAISYTLRHWEALCRYTETGYLEASNNFAERCMRQVAVGRKAFLFVGCERAGHAAAIYYSIVQSCKVNQVNPLIYLTYVLNHVRN